MPRRFEMKKILFIGICLALFLSIWVSASNAQMCERVGECMGMGEGMMGGGMQRGGMEMMHGRPGGMMGEGGPVWKSLIGLGLDDKQKDALRAIRSKVMKEAIRKGAELRIAELEQKDLLDKDTVDMKAVESKLKQVEKLRTELHLLFIKALEEVKSKLTPEQRKKFRDAMDKGPMMGGMGMMHCPDCGMMAGEECHMMGGMKHRGPMEGQMSEPAEEKEPASPGGHKHH